MKNYKYINFQTVKLKDDIGCEYFDIESWCYRNLNPIWLVYGSLDYVVNMIKRAPRYDYEHYTYIDYSVDIKEYNPSSEEWYYYLLIERSNSHDKFEYYRKKIFWNDFYEYMTNCDKKLILNQWERKVIT